MAIRNANKSREIFDESNEYIHPIAQQGPNKPEVDADFNDGWQALATAIRRAAMVFGDGSPNNGFLIAQSTVSTINNFKVTGGDGTLDGAGRLVQDGFISLLKADVDWNTLLVAGHKIHDQSSGLTATILTNTGANWIVNELTGRLLCPNILNGTTYTIASNTATAITIAAGDMTLTASTKDTYRVDPSTPGIPRTDIIYLDIYLDEIDETEDTNLLHPLVGAPSFASCLRNKLKHVLNVRENSVVVPTNTTDVDGNIHYYVKVATLTRDANNTITTAEIANNINRDIFSIEDIRAEIIAARGSEVDLDARISAGHNADGSHSTGSITSDDILNDEIVDTDINTAANIDQTKIGDSVTENDSFVGVPADLEDDLNQIRTEIKDTKGTAGWLTVATRTLESVEAEQTTARGSTGALDTRLDVSLNENGTLKALAVGDAIPRLASEPSLLLYPKDTSWTNTYRLHSFRGFLKEDYSLGGYPAPYVDYNLSHGNYPLDVVLGGVAGPGGADNTAASTTVGLNWYNVFLIAKADGTLALIYAAASTLPWTIGPLLDASIYDFPANGWIYWKYIGALRNGQAGSWQIVPMRKIGNHVEFEQAQLLLSGSGLGAGAIVQVTLATRVCEQAMRVNLLLIARGQADGGVSLYVRPASVGGGGQTMLCQDPGAPLPNSPLSVLGVISVPTSTGTGWKLGVETWYADGTNGNSESQIGFCAMDDLQRVEYRVDTTGVGTREWEIWVEGYEEFTDYESGEITF